MKYEDMFKTIMSLEFDRPLVVYEENKVQLFVLRPSKLSARFKTYDVKKNFQIWLREDEREFRPNHLRVMIDVHLRVRSRSDLREKVATLFDNTFYKEDLTTLMKPLSQEHFEHFLNPLDLVAQLSQLFLIEQEYAYHRESKFDPGTLFYQGWLRQTIDDTKEIDNIVMSIASGRPPSPSYTSQDDRKHKAFNGSRKPLWWLTP